MNNRTNRDVATTPSDRILVLVHGMTQDSRVFSRQVEAFEGDFAILTVDLPGHGAHSHLDGPFGHREFAAHVKLFLEEAGASRVHYWGTHTGATIGLYLAATSPGLISSLVLEGPLIAGANPPVVVNAMERAKDTLKTQSLEAALAEWWDDTCWFEYMRSNPEICRADDHFSIVRSFGGAPWQDILPPGPVENILPKLNAVTVPVLIYNGEFDHPEFLEAAAEIADLLPNVEKSVIPEAGGFPAWERPKEVNRLVRAFLNGN